MRGKDTEEDISEEAEESEDAGEDDENQMEAFGLVPVSNRDVLVQSFNHDLITQTFFQSSHNLSDETQDNRYRLSLSEKLRRSVWFLISI